MMGERILLVDDEEEFLDIMSERMRNRGMDVFTAVTGEMNRRKEGSCFFLGSTEETLAKIREKMAELYPYVEVVGT
mgnify:CR=1 FL=1